MGDMTGIIIAAWAIGVVGVGYGMLVALTGRARLIRGSRVVHGAWVRAGGVACAVFAALVAWFILTHPTVLS
jgi:hypothetical protein